VAMAVVVRWLRGRRRGSKHDVCRSRLAHYLKGLNFECRWHIRESHLRWFSPCKFGSDNQFPWSTPLPHIEPVDMRLDTVVRWSNGSCIFRVSHAFFSFKIPTLLRLKLIRITLKEPAQSLRFLSRNIPKPQRTNIIRLPFID
jgi:hypothetical protein